MKYKNFGKTNLKACEPGLGCQSLGDGLYHRDDKESKKTLHKVFNYGVNFYDVSDLGEPDENVGALNAAPFSEDELKKIYSLA